MKHGGGEPSLGGPDDVRDRSVILPSITTDSSAGEWPPLGAFRPELRAIIPPDPELSRLRGFLLAAVSVVRAVTRGAALAATAVLAAATRGQAVGGPSGGGNEQEGSDEGSFLPEFHAELSCVWPRTASYQS